MWFQKKPAFPGGLGGSDAMGRHPAKGPSGLYNARGWGEFRAPRSERMGHTTIPLTDRKR